ncbi:Sec-independent protein translocase protein TatB [Tsukamurella soli]|uniref:Sec-independent protein translocase protein TatB n=1 Tax=Tsukamurella soli TaxID=644556 RepID=A0ABP8KIG0_9ACTN
MFNIGWGEFLVLAVAGLVILGPERLPGAVQWTMTTLRQVREYATGATQQLKDEMGTDFEEFREPLQQLQQLRGMTPAGLVTKHLFDGDSSFFTSGLGGSGGSTVPADAPLHHAPTDAGLAAAGTDAALPAVEVPAPSGATDAGAGERPPTMPRPMQPLRSGERPPFDPDST